VTSYFNIDAYLENQRVKLDLYNDEQQLYTYLLNNEGNSVNFTSLNSDRFIDKNFDGIDFLTKDELTKYALDLIEGIDDINELNNLRSSTQSPSEFDKVFKIYERLLQYFPEKEAFELTTNFALKSESKEYQYYMQALDFLALHEEDHYKQAIYKTF